MRIERLLLEHPSSDGWSTFAFHPGMTVIGGVGPAERDALVGELIGSLCGTSSGVHTEFRTDKGQRYAAVRSNKVPHMVIDSTKSVEVTEKFTNADGVINIFDALDMTSGLTHLALTEAELVHRGADDRDIDSLARLDQALLWDVAAEIKATSITIEDSSDRLSTLSQKNARLDFGQSEDAFDALEAIAYEQEQGAKRAKIVGALIGIVIAGGGVSSYLTRPSLITMVLAAITCVIGAALIARVVIPGFLATRAAKGQSDGDSLFSMQLDRVNTMFAGNDSRKVYREAVASNERAVAAWNEFASGIDLNWAMTNRAHIEKAAEMFRRGDFDPATATPQFGALVCRLGRPERTRGESMPMIMSEPFVSMTKAEKHAALHLLALSAGDGQRIVLSSDPDIAEWARQAVASGEYHLDLVEPGAA